jgi:hypothetical protein
VGPTRHPPGAEIFAILHTSSLGFTKMHMGPHAASVISTDLAEATCGPICILTKPNNETCKIANPSPCAPAPPGLYAYKSHLPPPTIVFFFPHRDVEQRTLVGRLHPWASRATRCSPSVNQVAAPALRPLPCWAATSWTLSAAPLVRPGATQLSSPVDPAAEPLHAESPLSEIAPTELARAVVAEAPRRPGEAPSLPPLSQR